MAKQKGIVKLEGTIGDITFLKTQDGYLAKEKSSIPAARIANDPAFQEQGKTVLNLAEQVNQESFYVMLFVQLCKTLKTGA